MAQENYTTFNPLDESTWPLLDTYVLWCYQDDSGKLQYQTANLSIHKSEFGTYTSHPDGEDSFTFFFWFNPIGVSGYEWETELNEKNARAWTIIPAYNEGDH